MQRLNLNHPAEIAQARRIGWAPLGYCLQMFWSSWLASGNRSSSKQHLSTSAIVSAWFSDTN